MPLNMLQVDDNNIWHPFSIQSDKHRNTYVSRGDGAVLFDENGKEYIDLVSSWWCNLHGHANSEIAEAISCQAKKLEHVIFSGYTHDQAVDLTQSILNHMPDALNKIFFSDNGSTSIEIAMKIAYQYYVNTGDTKRNTFVAFEGGYHGDTFGAMAIGASNGYHDVFVGLLGSCKFFKYPCITDGCDIESIESDVLGQIDDYFSSYGNTVIAAFIEPLVQGASGMQVSRPQFLNAFVKLCHQHNIIVVFDEIMTGFFRTGKMFAMDYIDDKPDIVCLSKGLTGGFLPLGLTVVASKIYEAFRSHDIAKAFMHGHTYTGNPISCSAANASYKILMRDATQRRIAKIEEFIRDNFYKLNTIECVRNVRAIGCIGAFDLSCSNDILMSVVNSLKNEGILMRPLMQRTLYWIPPYCITDDQMIRCFDTMFNVVSEVAKK